ncbi:MAG TPA: ATP-binding protein [Kofleriaceae bacterium]|jgi:AAA+ superfamily predicted ATPase|nr:ATP-binding protein [Kofleriaceae bacterium]
MPSGQPWFDDEPRDGEPRAVEPLFDPAEHLALLVRRFLGQLERFRARADAPDASEDAAGRRFALDRRLAAFDAELHARLAISDPALLPIEQLQRRFGLRDQTIELLIGAAASALDLTAARAIVELTGSAQCDVGFLCNVIADDPLAQRLLLGDLGEVAPLVRYRLVRLGAARGWLPEGPLMMAPIMVPDRVVRWLRGETHFEGQRFERSARLLRGADGATFEDATASLLDRVLFRTADGGARLPTVVAGPSLSGKTTAVVFAADVRRATVLELDLHPLMFAADPLETIQDVVREACLHDAVLLVRHAELLLEDRRANLRHAIAGAMADGRLWVVLTTRGEVGDFLRMAPGTQLLRLDMPTETEQLRLWHRALPPAIPRAADLHPERLVRRYHLTPGDIGEAAGAAVVAAMRQGSPVTLQHMTEAVRGRLRHRLKDIADVVETTVEWDDIVLREDIVDRIIELLSVVQYEKVVMDQWGFSQRFSYGRGLSALFSGPPGTGKTMIAGLIAKELGLELFRVDLSRIVSKWVGETEKNLATAFDEAKNARAILLFDEADALFGKRTEVRSSNDRYANLETNYLLQRIEVFEGIVLLTTNRETSIDEAFRRRLKFRIEFPTPDAHEREQLWRSMIPDVAPLGADVDFGALAERFQMTGGYIKNAAMRAAYLAATSDRKVISQGLLEKAAALEWEEMGKL